METANSLQSIAVTVFVVSCVALILILASDILYFDITIFHFPTQLFQHLLHKVCYQVFLCRV